MKPFSCNNNNDNNNDSNNNNNNNDNNNNTVEPWLAKPGISLFSHFP